MKPEQRQPEGSGLTIYSALYVVFKHKWKIALLTLLGLGAAAGYAYKTLNKPSYESVAKLMVQYVVERSSIDPEAEGQMMGGGMLTEMEILTSDDTAVEVARKVGPERLVSTEGGEAATAQQAAVGILKALQVDSPEASRQQSNILHISYRSHDPELCVEVLQRLIETYFTRHLELHRSTEAFDQVAKQADQSLAALRQTEAEINRLKEQSGVLTVEATMAEFEARRQAIRQSYQEVEAQVAEQRAKVASLETSFAKGAEEKEGMSGPEDGTVVAGDDREPADPEAQRERAIALGEYQNLAKRFELLQDQVNRLLIQRKPGDPMVRSLELQIKTVRRQMLDLEMAHPELARRSERSLDGLPLNAPVSSLEDEKALLAALEAKLAAIGKQSEALDDEVARLSQVSFELQELERARKDESDKYSYFKSSLEKARVDETLDPSRIPNIKVIQKPSAPVRSIAEKAKKIILGIAASGFIAGLGLAFLLEMVIDRRVTRPIEIETRLQLPLMMSIPYTRSKDSIAQLIGQDAPRLGGGGDWDDGALAPLAHPPGLGMLDAAGDHFISPYASAIRDRLIFNFEVNDVTHKPKLVAVTGLSAGAGASTVAAGIARAFAETGDRKVLLVDLHTSPRAEVIYPNPTDSLVRALQASKENWFRKSPRALYLASAPTRREKGNGFALVPTKLHELLPAISASDFDYIVFDMPTVSPTSPTLAMAGLMDKVLLVLDAENTTRESLQWGYSELEKGRADVSCIYNKARNHAPRWVQGAA